MLSMQDFPVDFAAVTTLKWGKEEKKTKMSENQKKIWNRHSVSTLFARGCSIVQGIKNEFTISRKSIQRQAAWRT